MSDGDDDDDTDDRGLLGRARDAVVEVGGLVVSGILDAL